MASSVYCISYDLLQPNRDYSGLIEAIKSYSTWWHQTQSVWFILTEKTPVDIRTHLSQHIDADDKLFIIKVEKYWAGKGFSEKEYKWLHDNLK